jgi:hypothetical protein
VSSLWGIYSDAHDEVDLGGDREGLRRLAQRFDHGDADEPVLDDPPSSWREGAHALRSIRFEPNAVSLILVRREDRSLVISGPQAELTRIFGGSIAQLADAPHRVAQGSVPTHLHLDPTSDPENRVYSPASIALTVHLSPED